MDIKVREQFRFSKSTWLRLRCSFCQASLEEIAGGAFCSSCSATYQVAPGGALDLRLTRTRRVSCNFTLGEPPDTASVDLTPLKEQPGSTLLQSLQGLPWHLSRELLSYLPPATAAGATALDLGCGVGLHRAVCEKLGYEWVGLDYTQVEAPILGDAHALPFESESFDFILSLAVLEHLQFPAVAMSEAWRVLKPGGSFVGTVAFLEPFHGNSYYHHTHLGTLNSLRSAGFEVSHIAPSTTWTVLKAQAEMAFFPRMPGWLRNALVAPLELAQRLWWVLGGALGKVKDPATRIRHTSGMFAFVATKPVACS